MDGICTLYLFSFVETPRKFIIAELSIRKLGSSSVLIILKVDEDIRRRSKLTDRKLCNNKFTWSFHKAKQVYRIHNANVQETYVHIV